MNDYKIYERAADQNNYFFFCEDNNNIAAPHFHEAYEFIVVTSGTHKVCINGEEHILEPGDIAFSDSYNVHFYHYINQSEVVVLLMDKNMVGKQYINPSHTLPNFMKRDERVFTQLRCLFEQFPDIQNCPVMHQGYATLFVSILLQHYTIVTREINSTDTIHLLLTYIEENLDDKLTLDFLAHKFGYSINHLSYLFNRYTQEHFRDYLNKKRLLKAKNILEKENCTHLDVANACGFNSLSTFYRVCKKYSDIINRKF